MAGKTTKQQSEGKKVQATIDRIRKDLRTSNPVLLADFDRLVARKPGVSVIHSFLIEIGYKLAYSTVWTWYQKQYPDQFDYVAAMLLQAEGLHNLIKKILAAEDLPQGITPPMLPAIAREFRSLCGQLNDLKFVRDSQELELNGIYFAFAEMEEAQKDTAFEAVLRDLKRGVLAKYEGR